jgi:Caspase domain
MAAEMRKALLVGIDEYKKPLRVLKGCVNDALRLEEILSTHEDGRRNFDCRTMAAGPDSVTGHELLESVDELFRVKADFALFHFSGHGTINNLGGYLVTQDSRAYREGVRMTDVIDLANQSPVEEILISLDCCHAGAFGNAPDKDNSVELREGIAVLTASRDSQFAMENETEDGGLFSSLIGDALMGGAADILGQVTVGGVYAYVDQAFGGWDQRPLFKAHLERFNPIRECTPALDRRVVRRLPEYFETPLAVKPLDRSYEPTAEPKDAEHEAVFADLQSMRASRLVEPLTEQHLYWEAMNEGGCRLTRLGQYYWRLAEAKRI